MNVLSPLGATSDTVKSLARRRSTLAGPWCVSPDDLVVIVAGGPGKHSSVIPSFGATRSVTVAIED